MTFRRPQGGGCGAELAFSGSLGLRLDGNTLSLRSLRYPAGGLSLRLCRSLLPFLLRNGARALFPDLIGDFFRWELSRTKKQGRLK